MSKSIVVMKGDEFVVSENGVISVRRNGLWRWFLCPNSSYRHNFVMPSDRKITTEQAVAVAKALEYTIIYKNTADDENTPNQAERNAEKLNQLKQWLINRNDVGSDTLVGYKDIVDSIAKIVNAP